MTWLLLACTSGAVKLGDDSSLADIGDTSSDSGDSGDSADPCHREPQPTPPSNQGSCPSGDPGMWETDAFWVSQPLSWDEHTETVLFLGGGPADKMGVRMNVEAILSHDPRFLEHRVIAPWAQGGDRGEEAMAALETTLDCFGGDLSRVHLLGHSSGGYAAFDLALEQRFTTVAGFPALFQLVSDDALVEGLECEPVLNAVGSEDSWEDDVRETHERLDGLGVDSTLWVVDGEGHVPGPDFDPGPFYDWWAGPGR